MEHRDVFSSFHPIVNFLYFGLVLTGSMLFMHPACLLISLFSSLAYSIYLNGHKAIRFSLLYMLPLLLVTALMNPIFNHEGATILTYLHSGNPLTLESILYGVAAASMLVTVISWFSCYHAVMTSDKFVYLFGRIIPSLSLLLSMTLRFVPKFRAQIKLLSDAQRCVGRDVSDGSLLLRMKHAMTILSIMVTWVLENAIETADSMKSRGYGLAGRTAFSIYRFDARDRLLLVYFVSCGLYVIVGFCANALFFRYFPTTASLNLAWYPISVMLVYFGLCITPILLNQIADYRWKVARSPNSQASVPCAE